MSAMSKAARRRRPALATAALVAAFAVAATACGPDEVQPDDTKPSASAPGSLNPDELALPEDLPFDLDDLKRWKEGEWDNWDPDGWLGDAKDFINPIIEDLWDRQRMREAEEPEREVEEEEIEGTPEGDGDGSTEDEGVTDPEPAPVEAAPVRTPYTDNAAPYGKVFMDTPQGQMVCSGTVVQDPANPGKSNLVATAGHCVHGGQGSGWFRNVVFVPGYNNQSLPAQQLATAPEEDVLPHGIWWASRAATTDHWRTAGANTGGAGAAQDFAVLEVKPEDGGAASLQETAGAAVEINFSQPAVDALGEVTARGYPAAPPFDGSAMFSCTDAPSRLTIDAAQPTLYRMGCTMTGGSSGGGWVARGPDGDDVLYSVTSVGPPTATWLAGPRLGAETKAVFDALSG
ncbi:trypsin-like peptidase domain-containing protein [Streptomyces sp. JJ66]|uniref:trypsin-like serine peptidase n=1 Tax=Streptomyces sp. JJ66 TaxID=2803843 RepID=UPI001C598609|nr:trypsin-like peptidase domain-containing protein [Streptomyces sp. JJ66]MBW1600842.1 trypsin-like peptidase domain-containing protein [Streptomyces sp. JJ66]